MSLDTTLENVRSKNCEIEIFGLGYVGFPLAVRLSSSGFTVLGIDTDPKRIKRLENNSLLESELNLKKEFLKSRKNGDLSLNTASVRSKKSKVGIICVPTPIPTSEINSDVFVKSAIESFLNTCNLGDIIIIESSIEVGTTEKMSKIIESKGYNLTKDFGLCFCPERIDPQNKKWHLENIQRVIFCSNDISYLIAQEVYRYVNNAHLTRVKSSKIAEVVKSFENAFRLVNISLVNELAVLCDKLKINVNDVMAAAATKPFGFMPFYPGAGAGGHCIPKDPRFLLESAKKLGAEFKMIDVAIEINSFMPIYIANSIETSLNKLKLPKSILVIGLTYKPNTDDMRDSPGFKIVKELTERSFDVSVYDPYYNKESQEKYLIENFLEKINFQVLDNIENDELIKNFSCICVVQHHEEILPRIIEIYEKSLIPLIFECSNKLKFNSESKTILSLLGG